MTEYSVLFSRLVLVSNSQHHPQFHPITPKPTIETIIRFTVNEQKDFLELKISITYIQSLSKCVNKVSGYSNVRFCSTCLCQPYFFRNPLKML